MALVREPTRLMLRLCPPALGEGRPEKKWPSFADCMRSAERRDYQTRRYAGCPASRRTFAECNALLNDATAPPPAASDLARAVTFLDRARLVLLTERLDAASGLLARTLGWKATDAQKNRGNSHAIANASADEAYHRAQQAEAERLNATGAAAALAYLRGEGTALDRPLHAHAVELFERQLDAVT